MTDIIIQADILNQIVEFEVNNNIDCTVNVVENVVNLNATRIVVVPLQPTSYDIVYSSIQQLDVIDTRHTNFVYDSNGALSEVVKSDGSSRSITYTDDGLIETITNGSIVWSYEYDVDGTLINITTSSI